jgi:hypothetical protein
VIRPHELTGAFMKIFITLLSVSVSVLLTIAFSLTVLQAAAVGIASGVVAGLFIVVLD